MTIGLARRAEATRISLKAAETRQLRPTRRFQLSDVSMSPCDDVITSKGHWPRSRIIWCTVHISHFHLSSVKHTIIETLNLILTMECHPWKVRDTRFLGRPLEQRIVISFLSFYFLFLSIINFHLLYSTSIFCSFVNFLFYLSHRTQAHAILYSAELLLSSLFSRIIYFSHAKHISPFELDSCFTDLCWQHGR